jgi:hypothetical protein
MLVRVHAHMQDSYNVDGRSQFVINSVTPDEENPVSMPDVFTAGSQLWISSKALEAFFQFIKVAVSLCFAPLREAVLPDADEVAFGEWA